ncbi:MAG: hypothetical protein AMXMBFR34_12000 [Myxococcaceae bacterium]
MFARMTSLRLALLRAVLLAPLGVSVTSAPPPAVPASAAPAQDLGALMRQVHFAWRPAGNGWASSHATFDAHLEAGRLRFVPRAQEAGAAVEFGPARLARGGVEVGVGEARVVGAPTGGLLLERPDVVEGLHSAEPGVEQTWRFERAPMGEGALTVRVPVLRGRFLSETAGGLHFSSGALAVAYGHGTWVDAQGRRTPVPARFEDGAITLAVPGEVLAATAWPAVLDPVIGPEFGVGDPVPSVAYTQVGPPDVASDGSNFLVVWADRRAGLSDDVYGARVTAGGVVMDAAGIPVSTADGAQLHPKVAWDGASYLVVWQDGRGADLDVYGARVSTNGVVREPAGVPISAAAGDQRRPDVFTLGVGAFVAWEDTRSGTGTADIYGTRMTGSAGVRDPTGILVCGEPGDQLTPAVAWDGTNALVAWDDRRNGNPDIFAARFDPTGAILDGTGINVSVGVWAQTEPSATFAGGHFWVAWREEKNGNPDIYAARVTTAGGVLDGTGLAVATSAGTQAAPALAATATTAVVTWRDEASSQLKGARLTPQGILLDAAGVVLAPAPPSGGATALAYSTTNGLLAWDEDSGPNSQVKARRVTPSLMTLETTPVVASTAANHQQQPAIAWGQAEALVVWADASGRKHHVFYCARVSRTGAVLDATGFAVTTAAGRQVRPDVAWDGTNYFVVWEDGTGDPDIRGARVSRLGLVLDATPLAVAQAAGTQAAPAVAFDSTQFLAVWADGRSAGTGPDVYAARVSTAGVVLDAAGVAVSTAAGPQASPDVAFDGTNSLVVWTDGRGGGGDSDVFGARVTPAGAVLEPMGLSLVAASGAQANPSLSRMSSDLLLTWTDFRNGPAEAWAARVAPGGAVLDPGGLQLSPTPADETAVAFDGTNALVVMTEGAATMDGGVLVTRVSPAGVVLDAPPLQASRFLAWPVHPVVACEGSKQCLAVWQAFDARPEVQTQRLFARAVTGGVAPTASAQVVTVDEDSSVAFTLAGTDGDGDPLTFELVTAPSRGTLSGTLPNATFSPAPNFNGNVSFTFRVNDGLLDSAPATVTLVVAPVNDAPEGTPGMVTTFEGIPIPVTLRGTDIDGDALSFSVATQPAQGTLSGTAPNLTYTSAAGYTGVDSFTFVANDGTLDSAPATFTINVAPRGAGGGSGGGGGGFGVDAGTGGGSGGGSGGGGCSCGSGGELMSLLGAVVLALRRRRRG